MSLCVIDKYIAKKKRDLLEYAKILESIITLEENKMWSSKKEFSVFAKEIIDIYCDTYYFDNNVHRDNPIEYSNDNINFVLHSIIEYCKNNDMMKKLKEWKNEMFILSVIICTACYADMATNPVDGDFQNTKGKFRYLLSYLKKTRILKISENKYWVNDLFNAIKKNLSEDKRLFENFENEDCYNSYSKLSGTNLWQFDFHYNIEGLENVDEKIIKSMDKEFSSKFKEISYELLSVTILKELISNRDMQTYLIKCDDVFNKKSSLIKFFDNSYLKKYVKLFVKYEEEKNYLNIIKEFSDIGIGIIYEYQGIDSVKDNIFVSDMEIIVNNLFLENNLDNKDIWNKNGIKFIVKNKED